MDLLRDALQDHRFWLFANWLAAVVTKALGAFGLADRAMAAADESAVRSRAGGSRCAFRALICTICTDWLRCVGCNAL